MIWRSHENTLSINRERPCASNPSPGSTMWEPHTCRCHFLCLCAVDHLPP
uniref:Uncharacterized protein n=1 Tax=Rhizophora mucronata TaxID=61149 RepID=A0A2P2NTV7_RHIMU